jgi:hypothetical protein
MESIMQNWRTCFMTWDSILMMTNAMQLRVCILWISMIWFVCTEYVDKNKSGNISFKEFRQSFTVPCPLGNFLLVVNCDEWLWVDWRNEVIDKLCGAFVKYKLHLKALFRLLDLDSRYITNSVNFDFVCLSKFHWNLIEIIECTDSFSGSLDEEEFKLAIESIESISLTERQISALFRSLDLDKDGMRLNDFLWMNSNRSKR